jgi:hypothetical protein
MNKILIIHLIKDTIQAIGENNDVLALALLGRIAEIICEKENRQQETMSKK